MTHAGGAARRSLGRFFGELDDFTRTVAPGRRPLRARRSPPGADTFEAWSRDPEALKATIDEVRADDGRRRSARSACSARSSPSSATSRSRSTTRPSELPRTLPRIMPALRDGHPGAASARRRSTTSCAKVLVALARADGGARHRHGAARADGDGRRRSTRPCASSAPTSRSATTSTTPGRTSPSTCPSPTRPAARSARCSTRPAAQDNVASTSLGAAEPANGENVALRRAAVPALQQLLGGRRRRGQRRLRVGPARLRRAPATSTATSASRPSSTRTSRATRARPSRAATRVPEGQTFTRQPDAPEAPQIPPELDP